MESTAYIALSRQMVIRNQLDVIANNLANMSTPGFRGERVIFKEYLQSSPKVAGLSFVQDYGVVRDLSPGNLERTGNPLDVAINGPGYFSVQTPQGTMYTRDGRWQLDAEGTIVNSSGYPILGDSDQPIILGEDQRGAIVIGRDGNISSAGGLALGRLKVSSFDNEQLLRKAGGNLYSADEEGALPQVVQAPQISQGMVENSNVAPIVEMTNLIEVSRTYQTIQKVIEAENERQRKAVQVLGKTA